MTLREQVEKEFGWIAKPARVRQRYPAISIEAPSHWRKTLRVWTWFVLGVILGALAAGIVAGIVSKVWP
jgi:hypothetical protein